MNEVLSEVNENDILSNQESNLSDNKPKLSSFSDLLSKSIKFYYDNFITIAGLMLIAFASIISLLVIIGLFTLATNYLPDAGLAQNVIYVILGLIGFISLLFVIYVNILAQIGVYLLIKKTDKIKAFDLVKKARQYFWKLLLVNIAVGIFVMLWSLLLIIPGIIMGVYYGLAMYAYMYEGYESTSALKRSKELVKDFLWAVMWRIFLLSIIIYIFLFIIAIPLFFTVEGSVFYELWNLLINILSLLLGPLMVVFIYLIFKELKQIKGETNLSKTATKKGNIAVAIGGVVMILLMGLVVGTVIWFQTTNSTRDTQRLVDIENIQNALTSYKFDVGKYPDTLEFGKELSYQGKVYLETIPTNPIPNGGDCPVDFEYLYEVAEDGNSYSMMYCLEGSVGDLNPGSHVISQADDDIYGAIKDYIKVTADKKYGYVKVPSMENDECNEYFIHSTTEENSEFLILNICQDEVVEFDHQDNWLKFKTTESREYQFNILTQEENLNEPENAKGVFTTTKK